MKICHYCNKELNIHEKVTRQDACPHCGSDLHCCIHCKFYDENAHNKCNEPQSEWISDREKANFCEFFSFRDKDGKNSVSDEVKRAKVKLEELFKR